MLRACTTLLVAAAILASLPPASRGAGFSLSHTPARVAQGGWVRVRVAGPPELPRPTGTFDSKELLFFRGATLGEWEALAGADLDLQDGKGKVVVRAGGEEQSASVRVTSGNYEVERLDLPPGQVNPTRPEVLERIGRDRKRAKQAGMHLWDRRFPEDLAVPCEGRLSSSFGRRRILNGTPKSPHGGLDIAAPKGTPVHAAQAGEVRMVEDMFYSGHTLFLDHGAGWMTSYMHLSDIVVKEGQAVEKGQLVGHVGATGRATGPHLHWGLQWLRSRVDPLELVPGGETLLSRAKESMSR